MASPIPTQLSPGVNITEIDLSQFVQPESLNSAGMVGTFNWGPAEQAIRVTTESNLAAVFGKPTLDQSDTLSEDSFFAAANFLKYSNNLKVVRVLQEDDVNSTSLEPGVTAISDLTHQSISNLDEFALFGGFSGPYEVEPNAVFRGRYPGNFGNSLKVVLFDGGTGTDTTTTQNEATGFLDYEVLGIIEGTIGLTLTVANSTLEPPQISENNFEPITLTLGTTFNSFGYYLATVNIPSGLGDLDDAESFSFGYARGTTSENYNLTDEETEPSGNRENYFRPYDNRTGELYNFFGDQGGVIKDIFTRKVPGDNNLYQFLFLNADETNLAPGWLVGNTFQGQIVGESGVMRPITEYQSYQVSGLEGTLFSQGNSVFKGQNDLGNFDWYRTIVSKFPDRIFENGVSPATSVKGFAKFIAMTGGVTYANWPNGINGDPAPIGITFDAVGGLDGILRDFKFGMKQFIYNGTYTTESSSPIESGNLSSPIFDKPPQTSAYAQNLGGSNDEISFAVIDTEGKFGPKNAILEKFELLSKAVDAKNLNGESIYYKDYINNNSKYVYMTKPLLYVDNNGSPSSGATTAFGNIIQNYVGASGDAKIRTGVYEATLDLGQSGMTGVELGEYTSAYKLFADDDFAVDVLFVPESSLTTLNETASTDVENMVYNTVIEPRKDTVLVLPTPKPASINDHTSEITAKAIGFRNLRLTVPSNSYTMLVAGRKSYFDTFNNQVRKMSLSSDLAGILCAQEIPWESPAGFARGNIRNTIALETNFTKTDRDELYKNGINFFVQFNDGSGTVLFGDKTLLKKPSAFDRVNVRRVFIALEKAIGKAARFSLFEFNDEFTRSQFRNLVVPFLATIQAQRGITDFKVVCDETNNTPEVVDRNQFVADIYIKPAKSINFIQLNFIAVRSDFNLTTLE